MHIFSSAFYSNLLFHFIKNYSFFLFCSMISALNLTYLVICDTNYPSVLAFAFLDEVQREFLQSNEREYVESVTRPYALIQFGK